MNNEINGVTVSKIGVYMCVDDPLNIYKNAFTPQNPVNSELILNQNNFDINNFNSSIQEILNNSNITNIVSNFSIVNTTNIMNKTNESYVPKFNRNSTTTNMPTTTKIITTTTTIPTTTTTTTIPATTIPTTTIPITTQATITTKSSEHINKTPTNQSFHYDALNSNIRKQSIEPFNKRDDTVTILIITFSIITCCCCATICYLKREKIKLKSNNVVKNEVPQLKLPPNRKRQSKTVVPAKTKKTLQSLKAPPIPSLPPPGLPVPTLNNESFTINVNPNKPLTPVNNRRLKFSSQEVASVTTPKTHEWYKQTFADEINDLQETFSPRQKQNHIHTKVKTINFERNPPGRKKINKREFSIHPSKNISPDNRGNFRNKRLNSWNK